MYLSSRKQAIIASVKDKKTVSVQTLIDSFNVSPITIRRDLDSLVQLGLIKRTRGEVHYVDDASEVPSANERHLLNVDDKKLIGSFAAKLVKDDMIVLLDSGSTTAALARCLVDKHITVVTNSLDACNILAGSAVKIITTGGMLQANHRCFLGPYAEQFLKDFEADILFLGATGVRGLHGMTTSSALEYNTKQAMLGAARVKYALFDSSKLKASNIYMFAEFSNVDGIITTTPTENSEEQALLRQIADAGTKVFFAD